MDFFKRLREKGTASSEQDASAYLIYVKCNNCGEMIRTRVDIRNDLSLVYGNEGETSYFCRKYLMGSKRCFQQIEVTLTFDEGRHLIDRQISGGEFKSKEEYLKSEEGSEDKLDT